MTYRYHYLGLILSLVAVLCAGQINVSLAQPKTKPSGSDSSVPISSRGGGSRGLCDGLGFDENSAWHSLIAITPDANNVVTMPIDQANLYVYVPGFVGEEMGATAFVQVVDTETMDLDARQGIITKSQRFQINTNNTIARLVLPGSLNLTSTTENSEIQRYFWQLIIICDPNDELADRYIEGWLQPIVATNALETWHGRMEDWFEQRVVNPSLWVDGLTAIGLGELAELDVQTYALEPDPDPYREYLE